MSKKVEWKNPNFIFSWLDFQFEKSDLPGYVLAVYKDGKMIVNRAYGYADLDKKHKMTTDHIFRIASHSKTFTATALLELQEAGKLQIDELAVKYLPWLNEHSDKRYQRITIRQLMSHSAGVIRDGDDSGYWALQNPFPSKDALRKEILKTKLVIDNNIRFKYSNYGYSLLGLIIESASGDTYNNYVQKNIVDALGLKNTGPEINDSISSKLATGYTRPDSHKKRLPIEHISTNAMASATGFYSTAEDICIYLSAQMIGSGKLLNDESKKEMQRVQWSAEKGSSKTDYGLGLDIQYYNDRTWLGHGGGFPGFITKSLFNPESKLVVVVLTNAMGAWASGMVEGIIRTFDYLEKHLNEPLEDVDLKVYEGRYMSLWNMLDIISLGDKLVSVWSEGWDLFENPEELEYLKKDTFKITKTSGFASPDEIVKFKLSPDGSVESIIYAGELLLPEKNYRSKLAKIKRIETPKA